MRRIIFSLLLVCPSCFAADGLSANQTVTPLQINQMPEQPVSESTPVITEKEEKISSCMSEYVQKQSKSYAKIVQNNLYDLINNFDRITSRIYGKKQAADNVPYENKIEALARVQCEAYYTMGALK
jgi:hypothetical protein